MLTLAIDYSYVKSFSQKVNPRPKHRRQSAEVPTYNEGKDSHSYQRDSSLKRTTAMKDDETSAGGHLSITYQESGIRRIEHKIDRLEDLVWKLYEELDFKIQDLFDDHTNKFKQQNDIITNIFHGFGQEINNIKDQLEFQRENVPLNTDFVPQTQETPSEEDSNSAGHSRQNSIEDEQRLVQYMTTHEDKLRHDTLEEVIEEVSKGSL